MAECRITTVTEENMDGLVRLCRQFAGETPVYEKLEFDEIGTREFLARYDQSIGRSPYDMGFVAEIDEAPVGFLFVTMYKHPCMRGKATCDELMYTHPEMRGGGLGGLLVEEYKDWAKAMGADLVLLGSSSGINADFAEKFYAGHGFSPCGMLAKLGELDVRREDEPESTSVS
jgi:GNAT superfamily N-acetyltransferase